MFEEQKRPFMALPLVSIILCTFNRRHLVQRAIRSVLAQTWRPFELIIIDDGSTDGSGRLLRTTARKHPAIHYQYQANQGLARARNAGLRMARGKYVAFLDSDDEFTPGHVTRLVRFLEARPGCDGVRGGLTPIGPRSRQYAPDVDRPGRRIHVSRCHAAGTLMVRRSCLVLIGGFRPIPFSEDYDLIRRLESRFHVARLHIRTYRYHVDADHRLCDLFAREGSAGIRRFRRGGGTEGPISRLAKRPSSRS
jgi:glycosyltransferase involved in cell wall biosynthesis